MKLYCDPISTTSRPVMHYIADAGLPVELAHVDLMNGGNLAPEYLAINPNGCVPYLVDGDFRLGESSAILKYLADLSGGFAYPSDLKARAQVNAAMDWFYTNFHEYFCLMAGVRLLTEFIGARDQLEVQAFAIVLEGGAQPRGQRSQRFGSSVRGLDRHARIHKLYMYTNTDTEYLVLPPSPAPGSLPRQQPQLHEGYVATVANYNVIEHGDADQPSRFGHLLGHFPILAGGRRVMCRSTRLLGDGQLAGTVPIRSC